MKLEQTLKKIRQNLDVSKQISCFQIIFRQNLDIIQINLDIGCPKNLDKIQTKFRQAKKNLNKFRLCSKYF